MGSWLGRSGFVAAVSLIFLSELGDKTFFITALLAMRLGKWVTFFGATTALALTSIISVAIGVMFNAVPEAMKQSWPVGEYFGRFGEYSLYVTICSNVRLVEMLLIGPTGVALLLIFGFRSLRDAWLSPTNPGSSSADEELADAEETLRNAEKRGKVTPKNFLKSFVEVVSLIFVGEWGDRSMLATIALGAAQSPAGVASGAIAAHAIAASLAILGGALAGKYISEKGIQFVSGTLFILFAVATFCGLM